MGRGKGSLSDVNTTLECQHDSVGNGPKLPTKRNSNASETIELLVI